jgi:hypothetical protein
MQILGVVYVAVAEDLPALPEPGLYDPRLLFYYY